MHSIIIIILFYLLNWNIFYYSWDRACGSQTKLRQWVFLAVSIKSLKLLPFTPPSLAISYYKRGIVRVTSLSAFLFLIVWFLWPFNGRILNDKGRYLGEKNNAQKNMAIFSIHSNWRFIRRYPKYGPIKWTSYR